MSKDFYIQKCNNAKEQFIVYSTNYLRLEEYINAIENELTSMTENTEVIFDLLLSNGINAHNRFISIYFQNGKFKRESLIVIKKVSEEILSLSKKFYKSNPDLLQQGILSQNDCIRILEESN